MNTIDMNWKSFLLRALVFGLVIFAAVRGALARPGTPGGAARSFVTIAGTVTGVPPGMTTMLFTFRRQVAGDAGVVAVACERTVVAMVESTGDFAAEVPLEPFTTQCPETMFDGRDVAVDVAVNGVPVVDGGAVNPVPYAIHANVASAATPDSGLERQLATAAAGVPPGTIVAFGGERVPEGWLRCEGQSVERAAYPGLYAAIGTAWGSGTGASTFRLPDLNGRFLRGVDTAMPPVDPDRATRAAGDTGGNTGARVGTYQPSAFQAHSHVIDVAGGTGIGAGTQHVAVGLNTTPRNLQPLAESTSSPIGGSETRPINAAVNYIIRY